MLGWQNTQNKKGSNKLAPLHSKTMNIPKEYQQDFEAFPRVLRALLAAELAAGNEIAEIGHGFPAPPAGAYIKLAKPLCSRPRASGDGIDYYDRNGSTYSGEITDAK